MKPGSPEWRARRAQMLTDESGKPLRWFWLSFAGEGRFLGAVVVHAQGFMHAIEKTHRLGVNPGGEIASWELPPEVTIPDNAQNRLLGRDELVKIFGELMQPFKANRERPPCIGNDPLCPCQDGDMCHYKGPNPWPIPERHRADGAGDPMDCQPPDPKHLAARGVRKKRGAK